MSVIVKQRQRPRQSQREDDPRVMRTRAAVVEAARELFMRKGYASTTMEEIATAAGLTKRTLYNNYPDKETLFRQIVTETLSFAETFARGLHDEFAAPATVTKQNLRATLDDLARRMALGIMRPEVIALRRLLIGEAREFPAFGTTYFERAPGEVLDALASGFAQWGKRGLLKLSGIAAARIAAAQFAYLVVGEPLDRAMLTGTLPSKEHILAVAREGVETFLARY